MTSSIPCFLTINDAYVRHACVVIVSAACNSKSRLAFYILHSSLTPESKKELESMKAICDFDLEYVPLEKNMLKSMNVEHEYLTIETCYRLLIPTLRPELEKAIYLDADIVVRHDLAELWNENIEGRYAGVVEEIIRDIGIKDYDSIFPTRRYFNAGVLLLNLKKIGQDIPLSRFLEIELRLRAVLTHHDQDVLNIAFGGNVKYLPLKWNVTFFSFNSKRRYPKTFGFTKDDVVASRENPAIVHFIGAGKPWLVPCGFMASPFVMEYFKYLDKITKGNSYHDAVKKHPWSLQETIVYLWRHPFHFIRPKTYAIMKAKRKLAAGNA